ncbi:Formin-binding protein 1 [Rhizoclosmatium sp. JEL0117]|nr:Formin-binding protein 1 [Rhizoclosmatium sp. JEL0117]
MADHSNDFGAQLWAMETLATTSSKNLDILADYFRRRSEIEIEYAQKLQKLAKPHKDEITRLAMDKKGNVAVNKSVLSSSTFQAWTQLLNETENTAKVHIALADKMESELKKPIKMAFTDLESKLKVKFEDLKRVSGDLQKNILALDKAKDKYDLDNKHLEMAILNMERASKAGRPAEFETAKAEVEKKKIAAKASIASYQQALIETNVLKNVVYTQTIPFLLNEINSYDQSIRIPAYKSAFEKYYEMIRSQQKSIQEGLDAMNTITSSINGQRDFEAAIKLMKSNEPFPPDILFDEKPIYEITGKRLGRSPSAARAEKEGGDGNILTMPHKAGKKLAQDKIKQYDKELAELKQKLQSLENMFSVYEIYTEKDAKDPRYIQQLHQHQESLEIRITNIQLKKHSLQEYIAQADGLAPPPLPLHLTGKKLQSPLLSPIDSYSPGSVSPMINSRAGSTAPIPSPSLPSFDQASRSRETSIANDSTPFKNSNISNIVIPDKSHSNETALLIKPPVFNAPKADPIVEVIQQIETTQPTPSKTSDEDDWTWHSTPSKEQPTIQLPLDSHVDNPGPTHEPNWSIFGSPDEHSKTQSANNLGSFNPTATGNFVYSTKGPNPMIVSELSLPRSMVEPSSSSESGNALLMPVQLIRFHGVVCWK